MHDGGQYKERQHIAEDYSPIVYKNREWACIDGNTLTRALLEHNSSGEHSDEIAAIMSESEGTGQVCIADDYMDITRNRNKH